MLTEKEPDAAGQVHVEDQHENGLDKVQGNLDIVSRRHIVDDLLEAQDSDQLEHLQETQLLRILLV